MKKLIISLFVLISIIACAESRVLSRNDYVKMSENDIRGVLLQYTPIGSKQDQVEKVMLEQFNRRLKRYYVYKSEIAIDKDSSFPGKVEMGDYSMTATLESYGWTHNFFLSGTLVDALWLFNKDGILKDIHVVRWTDGV